VGDQVSVLPARTKVKVLVKRLVEQAQLVEELSPATPGSVGIDLIATDHYYDSDNHFHEYGTGIAIQLPEGYEAQIRPRSSISKKSLLLINSPGTIDSDYIGELIVRFKEIDPRNQIYEIGDRIAQLVVMPVPTVSFVEVTELKDTKRGSGGFGSTGK
jgi:dUTP pyrophosphatase